MGQDARTGPEKRGTTAPEVQGRGVGPDYSGPGVEAELRGAGPDTGTGSGAGDYETLYTARASSGGDRTGRVTTDDGQLDLEVRAPEQLGGPGGAPNAEQLLAAAYAACFHSSLELIAGRSGVDTSGARVDTAVELRKRGKGDDYAIAVDVTVHLPEAERDTAARLAGQAQEHCPYFKAVRGNVDVGVQLA
ncbi:Ohr subfamily peroxiredoxin [Streptosporangium becharense]|uniref:Ohr subfamily peroxiredoxin n=1 Tax=Streptosporangium becharense TaxID=1816182 RepID=A0A7W9IJL7_9ACTN|nr:Ohr family peroxiredoxin [Streptosporangium becharense]MBB2911312.1 Ohr subfamily peroxiredoxin [Streptosporangium becharense]MBB5821630.1 Ohr subfamily peroxiredoxin [Streptosporangium becharense]